MTLWTRLREAPEPEVAVVDEPRERRALIIELVIVGILTFGFSALSAILWLLDAQLTGGIGSTTVALNPSESEIAGIDAVRQVMRAARLVAMGALGVYLLWRSGIRLSAVGITRPTQRDVPPALGLAYFLIRLRQLGVGGYAALASSALLRGGYHLYQGFGGGLGNVVMGVVFARWYQVTARLWPLIIAHAVIDVVAFVGYALLAPHLDWLGG